MFSNATLEFWQKFLNSTEALRFSDPQLYDAFSIGTQKEHADEGAKLILDGVKIATSSHPAEYGDEGIPPFPGALSVLLDGSGKPVAVLETLETKLRTLDELDEEFARDYGEWDRTLVTLKSNLASYYRPLVDNRDGIDNEEIELLCERFRIVFRTS